MTRTERKRTVRNILVDARRLSEYRDELIVDDERRQDAIDSDLQIIAERLREINMHTGVDAAAMNAE